MSWTFKVGTLINAGCSVDVGETVREKSEFQVGENIHARYDTARTEQTPHPSSMVWYRWENNAWVKVYTGTSIRAYGCGFFSWIEPPITNTPGRYQVIYYDNNSGRVIAEKEFTIISLPPPSPPSTPTPPSLPTWVQDITEGQACQFMDERPDLDVPQGMTCLQAVHEWYPRAVEAGDNGGIARLREIAESPPGDNNDTIIVLVLFAVAAFLIFRGK